ncbi:MAG: hypothetical protein AB1564_07130 [Chloroflexota bacterium]
MNRPFAAAIAIAIGLIVLLGYFLPIPVLSVLRLELVQWAILLAGIAALVGVFNLISVHWQKIRRRERGNFYSAVLLLTMFVTLAMGLLLGPTHSLMQSLVEAVIIPVEASLMALLAVTLVYASIRLFRRRVDLMTVVFLLTLLLVLFLLTPIPSGGLSGLADLARSIINVPASGGARGILLGVALGALVTGLRVLLGMDRPYGGK